MSSKRHRHGAHDVVGGLLSIIDGRPFNARQFKTNNLRQHARFLGRTYRYQNRYTKRLAAPCARLLSVLVTRGRSVIATHPTEVPCVSLLLRMAEYRDEWQRSPETWWPEAGLPPEEEWRSLLRHLFARFPVPACFETPGCCPVCSGMCIGLGTVTSRRVETSGGLR